MGKSLGDSMIFEWYQWARTAFKRPQTRPGNFLFHKLLTGNEGVNLCYIIILFFFYKSSYLQLSISIRYIMFCYR